MNLQKLVFFLATRFHLVPQVFHNIKILTSTHPPKIAATTTLPHKEPLLILTTKLSNNIAKQPKNPPFSPKKCH